MNEEKKNYVKRHSLGISLSTAVAWVTLLPFLWLIGKPAMELAVTEAVAGEIQTQVTISVRPINAAFKVLLQNQINTKRKEIAALEYNRQFDSENWTNQDAEELVSCRIELESLIEARGEL